MGRIVRQNRPLVVAAVVIAAVWLAAMPPAIAASGSMFSVAEVVEEVQRQLAASDQGDTPLRIDDASLELALVEGVGSKAGGLAVPGADFDPAAKVEGARPSLKRRLVLDLAAVKGAKAADNGGAGAAGKLTAAIQEVKASVQQAMTSGTFDLKKLTLDFDFAVERDGKGQPSLIVYARDRRIDAPGVQGVKVRFSARAK